MQDASKVMRDAALAARNRRTGWTLAGVALFFFVVVIVKYVFR